MQGLPEQGELLIGLCYKPGLERLTVTVLEARGLNAQPEAAVMGAWLFEMLRS